MLSLNQFHNKSTATKINVFNLNYESEMNSVCRAIRIQDTETHGLILSPIRASFQNVPKGPVFFLKQKKIFCCK